MKINEFEISLSSKKVTSKEVEVKKFETPIPEKKNKGNKYDAKDRPVYGPYLEKIFQDNELNRYQDKSQADAYIKYEFLKANHRNLALKKKFKSGKSTIGVYRGMYNRQKLFSLQEPVYLVSFCYNEHGTIVENAAKVYTPIMFLEAYKKCIEYKIADPRFVHPDHIVAIRDRINDGNPEWMGWTAPPQDWIDRLSKKLGMEVFNSVYFPRGYTREESPADWDL